MTTVDVIRYWIAVLVVVSVPPALVYWFVIHPFYGFWRRRGKAVTFSVVFAVFVGLAVGLFLVREPLLRIRGPWIPALAVAGGLLYLVAVQFERQIRRQLRFRVLMGVPEIEPEAEGPGLLTDGVYGKTRNPRYLNVMIALLAFALMVNYLAVWVLTLLTWPAIRLIVHWEEQELLERFGDEYRDYCRRVPRFVPRLG